MPRNTFLRFTSQAVAAVALGACSLLTPSATVPQAGPVPEDFQITLERGPCFGTCPVYSLSVVADGSVSYDGRQFVAVEGSQTVSISQAEVLLLVEAVVEADFFDLADTYTVPATDLPSIATSVTLNGRFKSVYHYGVGCGTDLDTAPPGLCALEALLEGIPISNGWIVQITG
jgi:hypothetical protein